MKTYTKPLVDVFELRVTENIAAPAGVKAKWEKNRLLTEFDLLKIADSTNA